MNLDLDKCYLGHLFLAKKNYVGLIWNILFSSSTDDTQINSSVPLCTHSDVREIDCSSSMVHGHITKKTKLHDHVTMVADTTLSGLTQSKGFQIYSHIQDR